jgi:G:T-mismatch repair DNA endonuclease (very short patch repair protein)
LSKAERAPLTRPEIMARIRGKDTKPELLVRQALWAGGSRFKMPARSHALD